MVETGFGKPMKYEDEYLTQEQINDIIEACSNERDKLLLKTLFYSGRRVSEIVGQRKYEVKDGIIKSNGITPADIIHEDREYYIWFSILKKHNKVRALIPVPSDLARSLIEYVQANDIGKNEKIFDISRRRVNQIVRTAAEKAGIRGLGKDNRPVHAHHFRHSYAILLAKNAENPSDLSLIQTIMGHSSVQMTMWYVKTFNKKAASKLIKKALKRR